MAAKYSIVGKNNNIFCQIPIDLFIKNNVQCIYIIRCIYKYMCEFSQQYSTFRIAQYFLVINITRNVKTAHY
jgi:hypothetical protein